VLHLRRSDLVAVLAHARRDHPDECCGVMAGTVQGPDVHVSSTIAMTNAERSPTWFSFDPLEWLRVSRRVEDAPVEQEVVVVYHSHTMTEAKPSRTDLTYAANLGDVIWLLASTRSDADEVLAWRVVDGQAVAEEIVVHEG
jgi:proteasome lid subunit RPN8/RPN11